MHSRVPVELWVDFGYYLVTLQVVWYTVVLIRNSDAVSPIRGTVGCNRDVT